MHKQEWYQFLQSSSSCKIENDKVISFGNETDERLAMVNATTLYDLSHLGLLELKGADMLNFLQGQVTNDIKQLNGRNAQYSGYCNPKGRMLAFFLAFAHHDHVHLQMPKELIESIAKRLRMFVMRSKVEIKDVSESIIKIGLNGPNAMDLLQPLFAHVPMNDYEFVTLENGALLKLPGQTPRFEIFTNISYAQTVWNTLKTHATPAGSASWDWLEIQAGIPEITLKTQEEFVPQMLNLDALNAINYKKGCYTGQEIVARTHYLGKIKRRTQLAHIESSDKPELGADLFDANKQAIGKIVRCAPAIKHGYDVLAECRLESLVQDGIYWNDIALNIRPLPYSLD